MVFSSRVRYRFRESQRLSTTLDQSTTELRDALLANATVSCMHLNVGSAPILPRPGLPAPTIGYASGAGHIAVVYSSPNGGADRSPFVFEQVPRNQTVRKNSPEPGGQLSSTRTITRLPGREEMRGI